MEDMFITPIQPWAKIGEAASVQSSDTAAKIKGQEGISAFKSIFQEAIDNVRTTDQNLAENQYLLATGQIEDPHTVNIAASQAQLAVDLLVSLRSKALDTYNEIMRLNS